MKPWKQSPETPQHDDIGLSNKQLADSLSTTTLLSPSQYQLDSAKTPAETFEWIKSFFKSWNTLWSVETGIVAKLEDQTLTLFYYNKHKKLITQHAYSLKNWERIKQTLTKEWKRVDGVDKTYWPVSIIYALSSPRGRLLLRIARDYHLNDGFEWNFQGLQDDPALFGIEKVVTLLYPAWENITEQELEKAVYLCRNLYFDRKEITSQTLEDALVSYEHLKDIYATIPLFTDRHVLLFAGHDGRQSGRFWAHPVHNWISINQPTSFTSLQWGSEMSDTKQVLEKITSLPGPFTFLFDGHWIENGLLFEGADLGGPKISLQEFFEAYSERYKKFHETTPRELPIFIFASCFSSTFIRSFLEKCEESWIQKPICLSTAEYGQVWIGYWSQYQYNYWFEPFYRNAKTTLGDRIDSDHLIRFVNPTFYAPDAHNTTKQLSDANITRKSSWKV